MPNKQVKKQKNARGSRIKVRPQPRMAARPVKRKKITVMKQG